MDTNERVDEAVEVLQQLELKEYEAKCFVGLNRLDSGTAKQIAEITDVPRTRVYDAIRVLQAQGLVEVQHSSPQRFRAVPLSEATETFRDQYEDRVEILRDALDQIPKVEQDDETTKQEVWSMTDSTAIANRTSELIEEATDEVVFVVGHESVLTGDLVEMLNGLDEGVDLIVGAVSEDLRGHIEDEVTAAETFVSGLEWLRSEAGSEDTSEIGRLLLADRSAILVSTTDAETGGEHAIFGTGFGNGLVVISRRLMSKGLIPAQDPGQAGTD